MQQLGRLRLIEGGAEIARRPVRDVDAHLVMRLDGVDITPQQAVGHVLEQVGGGARVLGQAVQGRHQGRLVAVGPQLDVRDVDAFVDELDVDVAVGHVHVVQQVLDELPDVVHRLGPALLLVHHEDYVRRLVEHTDCKSTTSRPCYPDLYTCMRMFM